MSDQDTTGYDSSLDAFYDRASARIRHTMHNGEPFYSVIDMVALLTDSPAPRQYWSDLKRRLAEDEGFREVSEKIEPLKMEAPDGKQRLTDCANEETVLRIIESIPSPKAEPLETDAHQQG